MFKERQRIRPIWFVACKVTDIMSVFVAEVLRNMGTCFKANSRTCMEHVLRIGTKYK